jgi:branched-subunit amino acid aminotransferase/4-amino-4-deoxychorismate lyase
VEEVVFVNEAGELTEGSRSNLFVRLGDLWLTPPVECGLLEGTARRAIMRAGSLLGRPVCERRLFPADLERACDILLANALRGLRRARYLGVYETG